VQKNKSSIVLKYWWLFASFCGPFFAILFLAHGSIVRYWQTQSIAVVLAIVFTAMRSGLVGLLIACLIYILWKLDFWMGKPLKPDRNGAKCISILAMLLWLAWFALSQMIFIASDEVNPRSVNYSAFF
jgi:hypothetical protein